MKEKIKKHIEDHKLLYSCVATGIVFAGITCAIMKRQSSLGWVTSSGEEAAGLLAKPQAIASSFIFGDNNTQTNVTNNMIGNGRMSKIVSLDGTDRWFPSQAEAARKLGLSPVAITKHLNDGDTLPNGISLTRRGIAT